MQVAKHWVVKPISGEKKKKIYLEKSGRKGSHRNVHSSYCGEGKFQIMVTFFFSINFFLMMMGIYDMQNQNYFLFKKTAPKKKRKEKKTALLLDLTSSPQPLHYEIKYPSGP